MTCAALVFNFNIVRFERGKQGRVFILAQQLCARDAQSNAAHQSWKLLRSSVSTSESIWPTR